MNLYARILIKYYPVIYIMAKLRKIFVCTECGSNSPKWIGNCPTCGAWNTYIEEIAGNETAQESKSATWRVSSPKDFEIKPIPLKEISPGRLVRTDTRDNELNRVLGGGIVPGSLVLIGGEPGIGKSTLSLQMATQIGIKVLYVSGEESEDQIKLRADRLSGNTPECFIYTETNTSKMLNLAASLQPGLMIIDSIQTISSPNIESMPGTISQVRECTAELQRFAKETNIPVIIIGHITKEGSIAGPKILEHIVDTVLQFEGDRQHSYRILRTLKNRFGSTDEIGIYEMQAGGLRQVSNPSELLLTQRDDYLSGSTVSATMEGMRPVLIETQALVATAIFGTPQRSSTGFDLRRLHMLLAVLEKRSGIFFGQKDVFLNIAGGLKIVDTAVDLGLVAALVSSLHDIYVSQKVCFAGEIGLSGEIRAVSRIEQRIQEADRLGFEEMFVSKYNMKGIDPDRYVLKLRPVGKINEMVEVLFS